MTTPSETPACWLAPTQGTEPAAAIAGVGVLQPVREQFLRFELFDTFEWSLWYAGLLLVARGGREPGLELHDRNRFGAAPPLATWPGQIEPPSLRGDWPAGEMARRVGPLIELRALEPVAKLRIRTGLFDVKNEDAKTVVRLARETWSRPRGDGTLEAWRLLELRGYEDERAAVDEAMETAGLSPSAGSAIGAALSSVGVQPRRWSVREQHDFGPDTPSRAAATEMVRSALALARETERGICEDVDTEFLHDYRICIRKSRSVVSQLKAVFPPDQTARLKSELGELGRATNRLRDLDVYLLDRPRYVGLLPAELELDIGPLFDALAAERAREQRRVARRFRSSSYRERVDDLSAFVDGAADWPDSQRASQPAKELADRLLWRAYRRVCRDGRAIEPETPDAEIHRLRLDMKKLRYLLEHFSGLYHRGSVKLIVRRLKTLQDTLGDFNDYSVQREFLVGYVREKEAVLPTRSVMAVGTLAGVLHREKAAARDRVQEQFADFDRPKARRLCEKLFRSGGSRSRSAK